MSVACARCAAGARARSSRCSPSGGERGRTLYARRGVAPLAQSRPCRGIPSTGRTGRRSGSCTSGSSPLALAVVVTSVVRNLRGPHRPPATGALPTRAALRVCVTELEALHAEQNERAWRLADEIGEGDAIERWEVWAREWEQRVDDLADRCRLDAANPIRRGSAAARSSPVPATRCSSSTAPRGAGEPVRAGGGEPRAPRRRSRSGAREALAPSAGIALAGGDRVRGARGSVTQPAPVQPVRRRRTVRNTQR